LILLGLAKKRKEIRLADEIRPQANQRLDLVDITRWKAFLQEAFGNALGDVLGDPRYFIGAAANMLERPVIHTNFEFTVGGALQIDVAQSYTIGADNYEALIFDSDGYRLVGPNSTSPQSFIVTNIAIQGVDRYLIARRVATDASNESRKHYSAAAGEYSANTDTVTYDDWEISESLDEVALNVPAYSNVALRDAGWIDVATFQIDAVPSVTVVTANDPFFFAAVGQNLPVTWVAPPSPDRPDRMPVNMYDAFTTLCQIVHYMRWGTGATPRGFLSDPTNDGCFEEGGGLRFNDGAGNLVNTYVRVLAALTNQVTITNNAMADADDLQHCRSKSFCTGSLASSGLPDPANNVGYLYSSLINGISSKTVVPRDWAIDGLLWVPEEQTNHPWAVPAATHNEWKLAVYPWSREIYWNPGGAAVSNIICCPVNVPDLVRLDKIEITVTTIVAFDVPNNLNFKCRLDLFRKATNGVLSCATHTYNNGVGGIWAGAGTDDNVIVFDRSTDAIPETESVDNTNFTYFVTVYLDDLAGVAGNIYFTLGGGTAKTLIRESSHVY